MDMPTLPTGAVEAIPVGEDADAADRARLVAAFVLHVPEEVPAVAVLSPSKSVDDGEFAVKPAGGVEPMPEQLEAVLAVMPKGIGLTPDVESSVAPNGIPVNPTGGAGPMPSGEVTPSGVGRAPPFPLTCAAALPQPHAANNSEIINDLTTSRSRQDKSKAEAAYFLPPCALPCTSRGSLCSRLGLFCCR